MHKAPFIINASRRTDMPQWYTEQLIKDLSRYKPSDVHTLILWTKSAKSLIEMRDVIKKYDSVYIHLTVTGMGGSVFEPKAPTPEETIAQLPKLAKLCSGWNHIRIRIDPLLKVKKGDEIWSSVPDAVKYAEMIRKLGACKFSTSFCESYPKVIKRMKIHGFDLIPFTDAERMDALDRLRDATGNLMGCCVLALGDSACVDYSELESIHPSGRKIGNPAVQERKRPLCGCNRAIELGWYTQICKTGCLYCYARPY